MEQQHYRLWRTTSSSPPSHGGGGRLERQVGRHAELGGENFSSYTCGVLAVAEKERREGQETT
jgi:hypothetical protein